MSDAGERIVPTLAHVTDHRDRRRAEYPDTGDALDAIAEGFRAVEAAGIVLPEKTRAWLAARDRVKARFHKP